PPLNCTLVVDDVFNPMFFGRESAMQRLKTGVSLVLLTLAAWGCAPIQPDVAPGAETAQEPMVLRVTGYGTYEDPRDRMLQRHRLMAMRASKLDAYRALAERVYGTSLTGSSRVQDMVLQDDRYRTLVDSVIRGARVVSVSELPGGGFETELELVLEGRFRDCLSNLNHFKYSEDGRQQIPASSEAPSGEDVTIAPGVFRDLTVGTPRTLSSAPEQVPESGRNSDGARSNYYYHISKDK